MKVGLKTKRFLFIAGISAFSFGLCLGVLNFKNKSSVKTNAEVVIDNSDAFRLNVEGEWSFRPEANYEIMYVTREFGNIYFSPTHVTRYLTTNSADVRCDSYTLDDASGVQTSIGVSANIHLDNINDPDTSGGFEIIGNCSLVGNDIVAFWIGDESMVEDSEGEDPHITDIIPPAEYSTGWNYINRELFYYNGETIFNNVARIDLYDEYVKVYYSDIPGASPQHIATLSPGGLTSEHSVEGFIDIDEQSTEVVVSFDGTIELNNYRTSVTLNTHELILDEGETVELLYQLSSSSYNGTFEWHSSNENIATVSDKGSYAEVTAVGAGTATISITSVEYPHIYDECVVTVNERSYVMYTVTYDPNGAEGDPATDSTEWVLEGDAAIYTLLPNMFNRPNYTFLGWSTDRSSQTADYEEGKPVYLWSDACYYAVWAYQEPDYYTREICFNPANGGNYITKVAEGASLPLSYKISEDLTPTYEGHTFLGWSYGGNIYQPGDVISGINDSIVVVAQWKEIPQEIRFTITYHLNGADGTIFEGYTDYTLEGSSGVNYTFESCPDDFYIEGYYFAGWSSSLDSEEVEYKAGEPYLVNSDLDVYAVWIEESSGSVDYSYEIILDANDGTNETRKYPFTLSESSFTYNLPSAEAVDFTRDGYSFVGWSYDSDGEVLEEDPVVESGITRFYAIWSESPREYTFNITFQAGGAKDGGMEDVTITSSTDRYEYTLPQCGYVKEGYQFDGWIYLSSGTSTKYQPGDTCTLYLDITNTFRATWTAGEFVTITFNANGGEGTMEPITVKNGSTQTVPGCDFTYEGYDFVEWAVGSPTSPIRFKPGESVTVDDNYTLYAVWEAIPKQYWVNIDGELKLVDEKHHEYPTRIDKVIYSESKSTATVLVSIITEENPDVVIDTKYISLSGATCEGEIVTGYFNLIVEGDKEIQIEGVPISYEVIPTDEEKDADISQDQIDQINSLLPESQDSRVNDVIADLNQGTAYQIVEVASDAKTFIDELRKEGREGYTEEDYQRDLNTVQSATEAAVVVGAASKDTNIAAQVEDMTKSIPDDHGVDLSGVLKEFYEQQMSYLLGKEVASKEGETRSKGRTRAQAPEVDKINEVDVNDFLKQEFDQMLDFVDRSVVNIEGTLLQVRKCSHASVKMEVNRSITTITSKSFRDFDKEKADREFVETLEPVMMATMQSQVLSILEEEYKNSDHRNKEKDQVMLDEIEAIKDIEVFRIIVMEVLKEKYESLPGAIVYDDLQEFTDKVYWPAFEAWALDKESPVGFTFEELTQATIEKSTNRANNFKFATTAGKPEIIFGAIYGGAAVLAIAGAVIVPTVLKKKRRGLVK